MGKIAVYPGSFDPITNGHLDLIKRGLKIFDGIIVLVAHNPSKASYFFSVEERIELIKEATKDCKGVEVASSAGLLVDYVHKTGANIILRGLRALSDFEYEFQLTLINRRLNRDIETVFLMTSDEWFFTSSQIIREAASLGAPVEGLVPDVVAKKIKEKYKR
ncbi:MAG TPA: pantetheine-phosphate adenylyltransferase [Syntrophales bacterium]|nr:pantetheine-phosphate adenylyltransferase [Syntrophales bacterium]